MPGGRLTAPTPPDSDLSETGRRLRDEIAQLADAPITDTPELHAQRVKDLFVLWETAERGWERTLAYAQTANVAQDGTGLSVRGLARLLGVNESTMQARVGKGRAQLARLRPRRRKASA